MNGHLTRDFVGYGAEPPDPQWPRGARLALNLIINYEEGSEASFPDGDGVSEGALTEGGGGGFEGRDLAAESMYEYGSRAGVWRIVRLLRERAMTATVFGCAVALERNPAFAAAISELGYDVCCHGWRWERVQHLSEAEERDHIRRAVESIAATTGAPPVGWYCRYGPSVNTRRLLVEHGGFTYDSDAYNDDLPYWTRVEGRPHLVVPYSLVNNDVKFVRGGMSTGDQFATFLCDAFDFLYREGRTAPKMMSVGLHLRVAGHPARAAGLERFLDHVARHEDVWVCRRSEIASHWHTTHPAPAG